MDEIPALANVKTLYDGYTKFTTEFEYDMDNNKVALVTKDITSNIQLTYPMLKATLHIIRGE